MNGSRPSNKTFEKLQADAELYQRIVNELNHDRSSKDSGREEQILRYQ
jgi:hypothetical protein